MIDDVLTPEVEGDILVLKFRDAEQKKRFHKELYSIVDDYWWCCDLGTDHVNPNIRLIKEILYKKFFYRDISL